MVSAKQLVLKPQDFVVALKLAVNAQREFRLIDLSRELRMALSAVHGSIERCERARLISRSAGSIRAVRFAVKEFAIHGVKYAFPGVLGTHSRGIPTAIAGPTLRRHFDDADSLAPVWPDPAGSAFGPSLSPLHPSVPAACELDDRLFDVMTLLDALRVGAARERELALVRLEELLG